MIFQETGKSFIRLPWDQGSRDHFKFRYTKPRQVQVIYLSESPCLPTRYYTSNKLIVLRTYLWNEGIRYLEGTSNEP